jgi:hypothetical protein
VTQPGGPPFNPADPLTFPLAFKNWLIQWVAQELLVSQLTGYKPVFTRPGVSFTSGLGSPLGVVVAPVGSLYTRVDGGASTTLYVKESGSGSAGWVAK